MNRGLKIGDNFSLPIELVTSTQAILARKRSGKSYCASVMAEELLSARQQVVVIDPTGAWYGLKSSADGQGAGFPIVVFGGEHADVPLESSAGQVLAKTLVDQGFSAIFDVSLMGVAEAIRFVTAFMNELFHANREAMHLFIDEADAYAPERPFGEETKSLAAIKRLVKQGGIRGIGVTMITQRPQQISKAILSQVDILTVLRMSHPLDIKAATDWISSEVSPEFAGRVKSAMPSLPVGTAFICSAPLNIGERVTIRERKTFNSGATPKPGEKRVQPRVMAKVDLDKLGEQIKDTVEKAKANDPEALKRRIAELERGKPSDADYVKKLEAELRTANDQIGRMAQASNAASQREAFINQQLSDIREAVNRPLKAVMVTSGLPELRLSIEPPKVVARSTPKPSPIANGASVNLRAGARRMLLALCQWSPAGRTEAQLAAQVQMKRTGGTWAAYKSDLKQGGYIEIGGDGLWRATDHGMALLGSESPSAPMTTDEVVQLWGSKLRKGAREMLDFLVSRKGIVVSRGELGGGIDMEHTGGTFAAYLSDLKQAGLIVVSRDGIAANKETLML